MARRRVTVSKRSPAEAMAMRADSVLRVDRWVNERNRFGGARDPVFQTTYLRDFSVTRGFVEALYRYDWLTRRAIDIYAGDSTRKWIAVQHDDPKRKLVAEKEIARLNIRDRFKELIILARLYGGGLLAMGAWDGRFVNEPLGKVRQIRFLGAVDRYLGYPQTFYKDPQSDRYGEVETYLITRPQIYGSDVNVVHESRVVRLDGLYLPPLERIRNFTYGASVVESILEAVRQFGIASQGLAAVVQDFVIKKLKVDNLQELLQRPEGFDTLMLRLGELAAGMSVHGIATFGKDEEFEKMGTPITGLTDIMDRFVEFASAATGIPRSRLFNNLSGRLGGDAGENDIRVHYDNIEAYQENDLRPRLQRLLDVALEPHGFEHGEVQFAWNPLWQMTDKEKSDIRLNTAQADHIYIADGVVEPEEVAMSRFAGEGWNTEDINIVEEPRQKMLEELKRRDPVAEEERRRKLLEKQLGAGEGEPGEGEGAPPGGNGQGGPARTRT